MGTGLELYLEPSTKCALACPACPRTLYPEHFNAGEMDLNVLQRMMDPELPISYVEVGGDHGDPIYHSQFHDVVKIIKSHPAKPCLSIETNGSYRSLSWWQALAKLLDARDEIVFSIDGLAENNHLYRRNADWPSIETGIRTLRKLSPLRMTWKWILFRHNAADLEAGVKQARSFGFDRFTVVGSTRFQNDDPFRPDNDFEHYRQRVEHYVSALGR